MQPTSRGVEVLGTLALVAPKLEDFKFVKVRAEGEVGHLTLDRPEHNLLNERMLSELAAGINSFGDRSDIKLIVLDSAAKAFCGGIELGEYTQRRVFQLLDAFPRRIFCDARYLEAAAGRGERPGIRRRRGAGGAGRSGDCDAEGEIRAAGNQAGSFPSAGCGNPSLHSRAEAGAGAGVDRRNNVRRTRAKNWGW